MKVLSRNYVVNIFVDNSDVTTDVHWISKAMSAFSDLQLIPSFGNEINPMTGEKRNFLRMVTPDELLQVNIQGQLTSITIANDTDSVDAIGATIVKVISGLVALFPNKVANRIALLTSTLFIGSKEEYQNAFNNLHKPIDDDIPFEWDSRRAVKINLPSVEDNMNAITTIRRGYHGLINQPMQDSLVVDTDINTAHENQSLRFKYAEINERLHLMVVKASQMRDSAYTVVGA
ncbi:hypothetical protein [Aeromonas veronii]|uniref:hypothetical protein n=1 Tax=Aeromonas veronii TaxID=654 RepID=UPI0002808302|nr:hypothetical protein [Aeromonas veronii]EKB14487.1 hypothetical protein HMPREF1169_01765 [Aeromonas veronii AER397]